MLARDVICQCLCLVRTGHKRKPQDYLVGQDVNGRILFEWSLDNYRGTDKSLARPTFRCILFGENISFEASLVIYIYK